MNRSPYLPEPKTYPGVGLLLSLTSGLPHLTLKGNIP